MPTSSGTSVIGLQFLGDMPVSSARFLNLFLNNTPIADRLSRVGTVLICFTDTSNRKPVAAVEKLFSHGVALRYNANLAPLPLEVWVAWKQSGITWTCTT